MRALNSKIKFSVNARCVCGEDLILDPRKEEPFECAECGAVEQNRTMLTGLDDPLRDACRGVVKGLIRQYPKLIGAMSPEDIDSMSSSDLVLILKRLARSETEVGVGAKVLLRKLHDRHPGEVPEWSADLPGRGASTRRQLVTKKTKNMNLNFLNNFHESVEDMKKEKDELWVEATSYVASLIDSFETLMLQPNCKGKGKSQMDNMLQTIRLGHAFAQKWTDIGDKPEDIKKALYHPTEDKTNISTREEGKFNDQTFDTYSRTIYAEHNKGLSPYAISDKMGIDSDIVRYILLKIATYNPTKLKKPIDKYMFDFITDGIWIKLSDDVGANDEWTYGGSTTGPSELDSGQMAGVKSLYELHPYAQNRNFVNDEWRRKQKGPKGMDLFDPQIAFLDGMLRVLFNSYLSHNDFVAMGMGLSARRGEQRKSPTSMGYVSPFRSIRMTSDSSFSSLKESISVRDLLMMLDSPTVIVCGVDDKYSKYEGLTAKVIGIKEDYTKVKFNSISDIVYIKNDKLIIIDG